MKLTAQSVLDKFKSLSERLSQMSSRERKILVVASFLLFIVFTDYGVARPLSRGFGELNERISVKELDAIHNVKSFSQKGSVTNFQIGLLGRLNLTETSDESIRSAMLHDIEMYASSHLLELAEVKPQVSSDEDQFTIYRVRMQIEGTMDHLIGFFADLVKLKKLYMVESYRITAKEESANLIKASVTLKRVILPSEQDEAEVAEPAPYGLQI